MTKLFVAVDDKKDINGGFVIAAENNVEALQVFTNMFGYNRVTIKELKIH